MRISTKIQVSFTLVFVIFTLLFSSCGQSKTKKAGPVETTVSDTTKKDEGIAEITAEQMAAVGIELGKIEERNIASAIKANGQLAVPPQNKAVVNALVGGVIRRITVVEGQEIRKGQVVATIENPDFVKLQQDYLTSKDNLVFLSQEYQRQKTLKDADAGIGKVYQQASANYAAEQSKLRTLEAQLRQIHVNPATVSRGTLATLVPVLAPISGTVGKIRLSVGTYTDAASPIMDIVNNSTVYADLQVFENDIPRVRKGQRVVLALSNQPEKELTGTVYGIGKSLDPSSKSVALHATVNNVAKLSLVAGQYVNALIETARQVVPAVPEDAIVKANDKTYIYVFEGTETEPVKNDPVKDGPEARKFREKYRFKMTEIVTGSRELGFVGIKLLSELKPNAKIVTRGAFYIYSSMQNIETDDL